MNENAPNTVIGRGTIPVTADLSQLEEAKREAERIFAAMGESFREQVVRPTEQWLEMLREGARLAGNTQAAAAAPAQESESRPSADPDAQVFRLTLTKLASDVAEIRDLAEQIVSNTAPE